MRMGTKTRQRYPAKSTEEDSRKTNHKQATKENSRKMDPRQTAKEIATKKICPNT